MSILKIRTLKIAGTRDVETNDIPEATYKEALMIGLKILLNRGVSKYPTSNTKALTALYDRNLKNILDGMVSYRESGYERHLRYKSTIANRIPSTKNPRV